MKQKKKLVKNKAVNVLFDTNIRFVSLVDHGANQTAFNVVKALTPEQIEQQKEVISKIKENTGIDLMKDKVKLHKLFFNKDSYSAVESVEQFLKDNNYEGYTINELETGFEALSETVEKAEDVKEVELEKGITAFIQKVKNAEDENTDDDATEKEKTLSETEEQVDKSETLRIEKFDWFDAYYSKEKNFNAMMSAGMDGGAPPSFDDALSIFVKSILSSIGEKDDALLKSNTEQFSNYVSKLQEAAETFENTAETDETDNKEKVDKIEVLEKALAELSKELTEKLAEVAQQVQTISEKAETLTKDVDKIEKKASAVEVKLEDFQTSTKTRRSDQTPGSDNVDWNEEVKNKGIKEGAIKAAMRDLFYQS